ncbi:hypothetical protein GP486_005686 [Trichoglossum hirsutum]|uniref:Uncharacterized protein n=1 Tax=Trichoglossum hirsutum TaxID=265104 RepID=A0A9P8RM92_9PEZI|nr:hypothetical protein GP486_005686 [Trichoglossum hirsutum]
MVISALASLQSVGLGYQDEFLDEDVVGTAEAHSQSLRLSPGAAGSSGYFRVRYRQLQGVQFSTNWDIQMFEGILTWEEKDRGPDGHFFAVQV